jgi:hypothetical protein
MNRRTAVDQTAREERLSAIRRCRRCVPCGWKLGPDQTPIDPAVRCTHNSPPPPSGRDISEPIHDPGLFYEPIRQPENQQ